jgi:hypothetical protein
MWTVHGRTRPSLPRRRHLAGDRGRWLDFEVRVTATRKLFIATLLLVVGFGVARLMGHPTPHWSLPQTGEVGVARSFAPIAAATPDKNAAPSQLVPNGARLVPD